MDPTGETFGRYQVLDRLAVGGMAEIFLARSASINGFEKTVVIKKIRSDLNKDEQYYSMFINEARISITLSHPNIVQVFDFGRVGQSYFLSMEYVAGCDLATVLKLPAVNGRGLDPGLALLIMTQVCQGLDYAHTHVNADGRALQIVHRDISPSNVIVGFRGATKITDFGIAEASTTVSIHEPGMIYGKLAYMSPEQACGEELDQRTDVFSAGLVLWELLTGEPPYGHRIDLDVVERIQNGEVDRPSARRSGIPRKLDPIVMKALAVEVADRYPSARELGTALRGFLVRHYPDVTSYTLQSFLEENREELARIARRALDEDRLLLPPEVQTRGGDRGALGRPRTDDASWSPALRAAVESFREQPNLWTLVQMAEICEAAGQSEAALTLWRTVAAKFAQAGLLAQALFCAQGMLRLAPTDEVRHEIMALTELPGASDDRIEESLSRSANNTSELLRELLTETSPPRRGIGSQTPLLSYLDGESFAELVLAAPCERYPGGEAIVRQGEVGRTMYLITRGRVLVLAEDGEGRRIYLSSLTAGDFFGENGFFSGAPRSASVEALDEVAVVPIDQSTFDRAMGNSVRARDTLSRFYKERIADTVMAKSPTFGLLSSDERQALVDRFHLRVFAPGEVVIREGETSDHIFIIKQGSAEVFVEMGGARTSLSEIGPGTLFGEIAVLRSVPRTASVVATTELEALELSGTEFLKVLDGQTALKTKVLEDLAQRVRNNIDKVMGPSLFRPYKPDV